MKSAGTLSALILTATLATHISAAGSATSSVAPTVNSPRLPGTFSLPSLGDTTSGIISRQQEYELGRMWLKALRNQTPMVSDPQLKEYLENLVYRLATVSDVQDHRLIPLVIDSPNLNAFAAPGGIIGVNTGLFIHAKTEAQFAAVLAHELAHLSQRHYARNIEEARNNTIPNAAAILGSILIMATAGGEAGTAALTSAVAGMQSARLRFSRQFEREADNLGITTLARAGFDPQAMPEIFEEMNKASLYGSRPPEFLLTHPVTENRIASSRARADQMSVQQLTTTTGSLDYQLMRVRAAVLSSSNPNEMARQLQKQLTTTPSSATTRYGLALASMRARNYPEAQTQLKWLQQRYPDNLHLIITRALLAADTGKARDGLTQIDKALKSHPNNYPLMAAQAEILLKQQNYADARRILQRLSRLRPEDPDIWFELAEVQGLADDIVGLHQSRAEYYFLNGNTDDAIKHLQYAIKMADGNFALQAKLQQKLTDIHNYRQKIRNS